MTEKKKTHGGARRGAGRPPKARPPAALGTTSAEEYLAAVIAGKEPADPVRVRAATALIRFQTAIRRPPVKSPPPQQLENSAKREAEAAIADEFSRRAAEIRARHARAKGKAQ